MTTSGTTSAADPLRPGQIVAARYRLVQQIRGDSAAPIWRAEDLVLATPVALQLMAAPTEAARTRVLEAVRLARSVVHPAVCRVFDVVEADGHVCCALELVGGESLRTIVRRAGRLPPERVAEIARQLSSGAAALDAAGVRATIDASTVLLDPRGSVRIVDLGLRPAVAADPDAIPALLYELLVGFPPEGLSRRRIARTVARLTGQTPPRDGHFRVIGGAIVVAAALALIVARLMPAAPAPLTAQDAILLADFENTTGNPVFDGALKVALAVALEQSPFLRVVPDERARETLRLMQRDPDERLTTRLAREVAQREPAQAVVAGAIAPLGSRYVLSLEALAAGTGDVMAREQVEAATADDVLQALGAAAARLRGRLGESLASIERFDAPLPRATTASLEALHAYALALDEGRVLPRVEAIPHLQRAIRLDPEFAMAQAALSGVYRNTGRSAEAPGHARRAFELRDRVSERERYFISWRYYVDAAQQWDEALDLSVSWTRTYPREPFAFNSLGLATAAVGDHQQAVRAFREAIRLDPKFVPPHGNLAGSLIALSRFAEARGILAEAARRGIAFITVRRMAYLLAFIDGDAAAMAREADPVRRSPEAMWVPVWEARAAAFGGRAAAAHEGFRRGVQQALAREAHELAAQWIAEDAEVHAVTGDCEPARREAHEALMRSRDNFTLERAGRVLALCGDATGAAQVRRALEAGLPTATLTRRIQLPVIAAAEAHRRGDAARVLDLLAPVAPLDHAPSAEFWPAYLRGDAYLRLGQRAAAAAQFRAIVDRRGEAPTSPLYAFARRKLEGLR